MRRLVFRLKFLLFLSLFACTSLNKSIQGTQSANPDFSYEVVINDSEFKKWMQTQTNFQNKEVSFMRTELLKKLSNYRIWVKSNPEKSQNINYFKNKTYSQEVDSVVYQYLIYFEEKHNITL
ncbi:hypothetical protein [Mesonia sp. HuA40]|uniref:hypothetical protein n=1 Tax=Mesonia sp. HuA40 TaxID=2602761 RepID=UPI0011C8C367|nr:hypothetical protein [Mesonia sp. HuA40]TXK70926.1 hypothetical protein FT993_10090 [Mesonia sp. HuA40]